MKKKFLFKKKRKNRLIFLFSFFLLLIFFLYLTLNKNFYFDVPIYEKSYYFIPLNKGGKEIPNQKKRGLHLSYNETEKIELINNYELNFSIQLFSDLDYQNIISKRLIYLDMKNNAILPDDLFVALLNTNIGNEYLLLYKNFQSRILALDYCQKYVFFLDKCLIVDVKNLD